MIAHCIQLTDSVRERTVGYLNQIANPQVRRLRDLPAMIARAYTRSVDYLVGRAQAATEALHRVGVRWKDLIGIAGIVLILIILLKFFGPGLQAML